MTEEPWHHRTLIQIGKDNYNKLKNARVLVAGLGGVGSYAVELICRAGVGKITIVDSDVIHVTNLNRQLPALHTTLGHRKVDVVGERLLQINPELHLKKHFLHLKDELIPQVLSEGFDYVVDAIDTLSPKTYFIYNTVKNNIPLVSSMGAGGKYFPEMVKTVDISETFNCRLAYYIRKKLHKLGIESGFKAVFSPEFVGDEMIIKTSNERNKRSTVGTLSFMPAIFGCHCAATVINDLIGKNPTS